MSKKLFTDAVYVSRTVALSALAERIQNIASQFPTIADPLDLIRDNLPTVTDDDGTYSSLTLAFDPGTGTALAEIPAEIEAGTLAIVTHYGSETQPRQEGEPLAVPTAVYVLSLPSMPEMLASAKVRPIVEGILSKALLASARKIAKMDADGTAPLSRDRVSALVSAATTSTTSIESAWRMLFPIIQAAILDNVAKKAAAFDAAGRKADKRNLEATYNRARLDRVTLKSCLSSEQAARVLFPAMPQIQWENILRFAITYAPRYQHKTAILNDDGTKRKDEHGKILYTRVLKPQSPAIFQQWLDTRSQQIADVADSVSFTFDGMDA